MNPDKCRGIQSMFYGMHRFTNQVSGILGIQSGVHAVRVDVAHFLSRDHEVAVSNPDPEPPYERSPSRDSGLGFVDIEQGVERGSRGAVTPIPRPGPPYPLHRDVEACLAH